MNSSNHPEVVVTHTPAPPAPPRPRHRRAGPVTVVRPATIATPTLTDEQRQRRTAANQIAAELTAAARQGRHPYCEPGVGIRITEITQATDIIAAAPAIAADPPPGALRVGRHLRGRAVAVVLHADDWSLVLRPGHGNRPSASWAFIDGDHNAYFGTPVPFCLDHDTTVRGVEWTDMLAAVQDLTA
jgi:hypothetical protein